MPIEFKADPIEVDFDARELATRMAKAHADHCADALLSGQRADGRGSLPTNSKGQPKGRGKGTIANNWQVTEASGSAHQASATSSPYQEGGHFYAVRSLREKDGVDLATIEGAAGDAVDRAIQDYLGGVIR